MEHAQQASVYGRVVSCGVLAVVVSGCVSANSVPFLTPPPEPRPADHAVGFYAESRPRCRYDEIGTVSARKNSSTMDAMLEALRQQVRKIGGDAVIGTTQLQQPHGSVSVSGIVIRFRDQACTQ